MLQLVFVGSLCLFVFVYLLLLLNRLLVGWLSALTTSGTGLTAVLVGE